MKKTIFNNATDVSNWLTGLLEGITQSSSAFGCIEELESYFGIDFLNNTGMDFETYEDARKEGEPCLWEAATPLQYRERKLKSPYSEGLPKSFPCVAVTWFENSSDRIGDTTIRCMEYVYPADFGKSLIQ